LDGRICYWPNVFPPDQQQKLQTDYYAKADPKLTLCNQIFKDCIHAYRDGKEQQFFSSYLYNVSPTTDNSPFFFEYQFLNSFGLYSWDSLRDSLRGGNNVAMTIYLILIQSTICILLAVFWPLYRHHRNGVRFEGAGPWSIYFAAIGLGFMVV